MTEKQIVIADQLVNYLTNDIQSQAAQTVIFLHGWRSQAFAEPLKEFIKN